MYVYIIIFILQMNRPKQSRNITKKKVVKENVVKVK